MMDTQKLEQALEMARCADAEPRGEPVAWFYRSISGAQFVHFYKNTPRFLADQDAAEQWPDAHSFTPLYTHPPQQRKPLTDRQAIALWADRSDGPANHEIISFARAIERAITGETP